MKKLLHRLAGLVAFVFALAAHGVTTTISDNTTGADFSGTDASSLIQGTPNTNYSTDTELHFDFNGGGSDRRHTAIKFTGLSNISGPVTVSSVTLRLYRTAGGGDFELRRMLRNWVLAQCTWNDYATSTGWTTAGGSSQGNDVSSTQSLAGTIAFSTGYQDFSSAQLAADVEGFINGTFSNFGWNLIATGDTGIVRLTSDEGTDGQRPILIVVYTSSAGGPKQMTVRGAG